MQKSIWEVDIKSYSKLEINEQCDVCIIGGGITGISLAYYLKDSSLKTILIEQDKIGNSTTLRTTAKLTYLQKDILSKIEKFCGEGNSLEYYNSQKEAINEIRRIINLEKIDCDLEESPSYLFVNDKKNRLKLQKEFNLYHKFGAPISWDDHLPMSNKKMNCCFVQDTFVFHPLKYIKGLLDIVDKSNNIAIYEKTRMVNVNKGDDGYIIYLADNKIIKTKKLVFTGHYPPFIVPYFFPIKVYLKKEIVIARKEKNYSFNAINLDKNICSIRFYKDNIIQVIDSKRLNNKAILDQVSIAKGVKDVLSWINYDIMTADSLPIIGKIGNNDNNLYLATGYNAWGMTNSNLAAQIIASEIKGEKHKYSELFNPYRELTLPVVLNRLLFLFNNVYLFIGSYFPKKKSRAKIIWRDGKRYGVVIDQKGIKHEVLLTCPHMKCGLIYNEKENTWDCPCHGSRFDIDGNLIKGPATDCIKIKR